MLIRSNPSKAVPALLNRLTKTIETNEEHSSNDINKEDLNSMKDKFLAMKECEEELHDQCTELYRHHRKFAGRNVSSLLQDIKPNINQMEKLLSHFEAKPQITSTETVTRRHTPQHQNVSRELSEFEKKIIRGAAKNPAVKNLRLSYDRLDRNNQKMCLLILAIFPTKAVMKKRLLIYWWIGEGLIRTEEEGENIFNELLELELIIPHRNGKCPIVSKCQIHPWIRLMLIAVGIEEELFHFDEEGILRFNPTSASSLRVCLIGTTEKDSRNESLRIGTSTTENDSRNESLIRTIFNVSESRVSLESKWFAKLKKLVVLQLGRWQVSPFDRIEVLQSQVLLRGLRAQRHLKYLSLRGVSRITSIPPSIVELVMLEILDLKDCRNLETLPADISSLRKLTHLDVSECYLLENMPKGLDKLANLQVLKGFIIGNSEKTPCTIGDLESLQKLKRLSIHIGSEALIQPGEFNGLKDLKSVRCIKVSWGVSQIRKDQAVNEPLSFPESLEKLVLEGMPHESIPEWLNPGNLGELKKLYIKGGHLKSLDHGEADSGRWNVNILCLKYVTNLKDYPVRKLKQMFPSLEYAQKISITPEKRETIDLEYVKRDHRLSLSS